jgi:hypothetical protein
MKTIDIATVITSLIPYVMLIVGVAKDKIKQSFATWFLWLILDVVTLIGIVAQHGNYLLLAVFSGGTICVTLLLIYKKQFSWGLFETFVGILVAMCILILLTAGPYVATIAGTTALAAAGIPQLIATFKDPKSTPSIAYFLFGASSLLSVIGASGWTVQDRLFPMFSTIYCFIVMLLSLRKVS